MEAGIPDLGRYTAPVQTYIDAHKAALETNDDAGRVNAQWGLIAKGPSSVPYARSLLHQDDYEARADAASILGAVGKTMESEDREHIVAALIDAIEVELQRPDPQNGHEREALDSMVLALDQIGSARALPILSRIICTPGQDSETVWMAIETLCNLSGQPLLDADDPPAAARQWLIAHGY